MNNIRKRHQLVTLFKDGKPVDTTPYISAAETARILLNQFAPKHSWHIEIDKEPLSDAHINNSPIDLFFAKWRMEMLSQINTCLEQYKLHSTYLPEAAMRIRFGLSPGRTHRAFRFKIGLDGEKFHKLKYEALSLITPESTAAILLEDLEFNIKDQVANDRG